MKELLGIVFAALAVMLAWFIYRRGIINEKAKTLNSLKALLGSSGAWLGTTYCEKMEVSGWYNPGSIVYKIDNSLVCGIIQSNLISKELALQLTYFNQRISAFNQLVDSFLSYIFSNLNLYESTSLFYDNNLKNCSDYEDCLEKIRLSNMSAKEMFYIKKVYFLKKAIHVQGIGDDKNYDDNYPKLRKCFLNLEELYKKEEKNTYKFYSISIYTLGDLMFIFVPAIVLCFFALRYSTLLLGYYL